MFAKTLNRLLFLKFTKIFTNAKYHSLYRVIQNFASPSRAEMGQAPVKLTISPSSTFNLNWENKILASETFYNC